MNPQLITRLHTFLCLSQLDTTEEGLRFSKRKIHEWSSYDLYCKEQNTLNQDDISVQSI